MKNQQPKSKVNTDSERDFMLMIATGKKRVGKTYRTAREVESYRMNDPRSGRKGMKVLIFDIQQEPEWSKYPTINYDVDEPDELKRASEIIKFTQSEIVEVRRLVPVRKNRQQMTADQMVSVVQTINKYYRRGMLILEDINRIITSKNQDEIIDALISTRHIQQDIVMHLQSLAGVTPRMFQNVEMIRFHKQSDPIDRYKNRIPMFSLMKIAEITVDRNYRNGNERYFVYVSPTEEKIYGLSFDQFKESCLEYLSRYESDLRPYLKQIDPKSGKKKYTSFEQAAEAWINDHLYFWDN